MAVAVASPFAAAGGATAGGATAGGAAGRARGRTCGCGLAFGASETAFGAATDAGFGAGAGAGFGADLGAITSDASAFTSESDNGGSGTSSPFAGRPPGAAAFPAETVAGAPFRPSPPSRDAFLPCLAMGGIMACRQEAWQ